MSQAIVLIDGNNFYASCEQMIDPSLRGKGVVILSNNDGCIIARSSEARRMGIPMGQPYYKLKEKLNKLNISVRSSNYQLYGDISNRLMELLKENCEEIEIYSIDEAFANITRPKEKYLNKWGKELRSLVYQNLGIPITIGIGNTKVQSKAANHLAKKLKEHSGIFDIGIAANKDEYLNLIEVDKIWGVGKVMSEWLKKKGIKNARELKEMPSQEIKNKFGIVGLRIQNELKGNSCIPLKINSSDRKEICVSRSVGSHIDSLEDLKHVINYYTLIASSKLRKYNQLSSAITVFICTSIYSEGYFKNQATAKLNSPSNDTKTMLKLSSELTTKIFKPYRKFIKVGIIMHNLTSNQYQQKSLLDKYDYRKEFQIERLNKTIDNINRKHGKNTLNWASYIIEKEYRPRCDRLSTLNTTNIKNIPTVFAN